MEKIIGKHAGKVRKSIYLQGTFKVHNMNNWQLFFHFFEIYNALWSRFLIMNLKNSGLGLFWHLTFRQKTFWHRYFITGSFLHVDISSPWTFRQGDYLAHEFFCKRNFLAQGYFGTWIFRHGDLLAQGHFGTETFWHMDISAKWTFQQNNTFLHRCQKVCSKTSILLCMVPKFSSAEMSMSG